jgi:four helix bundle protein
MKESVLANKAMDFAVNIVELHKELVYKKKEYQIADQIKRSGTAIGALICEANFAESSADFVHKMKIALKECHETDYWLTLLNKTEYVTKENLDELLGANTELKKMLIASIKTRQGNSEKVKSEK